MKTKHTKGEWKLMERPSNISNSIGVESNGERHTRLEDYTNNKDEAAANAKLIAAAPELLEALMNLTNTCQKYFRDEFKLDEATNAIKKATE